MRRDALDTLLEKLESRTACVAIVGLGYVGLPLLLRCSQTGLKTLGLDIDQGKIDALQAGRSYIRHIGDARITALVQTDCTLSTDMSQVAQADAIIICVPTPLDEYREPDLGFVTSTVETLAPHLHSGQVLCLESTTYPGTTEEVVMPRVAGELAIGEDLFLVYSPEREDPGNAQFSTHTIPKLVSGVTERCLAAGEALYRQIVEQVVPVSSPKVAEMAKLLENIHRAVNIGLVNEMKVAADRMDIDINEVIDAAASKPFGFVAYRPGPGIGGHCIPIDPYYLTWKARAYGVHTRFIELAGEINSAMPRWVVDKIIEGLNQHTKPLRGSRVLVLGVAYKKNIDDLRHSPALYVMEQLRELGADLVYSDPHVPQFPKLREHSFDLSSVELTAESLSQVDCAVLITDHDDFDYTLIAEHAPLIVDTRGRFDRHQEKVIRA